MDPLALISTDLRERLAGVRAVLFDLDGTLVDTIGLILESMRHATTVVLGAPLDDEILLRNVGIPLRTQMNEFAPDRAEELLRAYRVHNVLKHDAHVSAFAGVPEALDAIAASGRPIGVVTSKSRTMAERGLAITGLRCRFDVVVTCDDTESHKPDPAPLEFAAQALGVEVRQCVYLGDSPLDVLAARAGGAVAVAATWGVGGTKELAEAGPDIMIGSIGELVALLGIDARGAALPRHAWAPGGVQGSEDECSR